MKRSEKMLLGVTALFAAGAIVGVLYAPDKGERTRRKIARKKRWLYNTVQDTIEEKREALEELRDRLNEKLEIANEKLDRLSRR